MNGYAVNGHAASNGYASNGHSANGHATTNTNNHLNGKAGEASHPDVRARLLESVLRLTALEDYRELSAPQIADAAGVSIDTFFELFENKQECLTAGFETISDELLRIAADPELIGNDWAHAVQRVIGALMRHLADHPFHARMIAAEVYAAGPDMIERNHELAHDIAMLLTEGAPAGAGEGAGGTFAIDAVAGAIWHTIRCQVASEQIQRLPALADHLSYVVLAPFIGATAAAELVTEDDNRNPATGRGQTKRRRALSAV